MKTKNIYFVVVCFNLWASVVVFMHPGGFIPSKLHYFLRLIQVQPYLISFKHSTEGHCDKQIKFRQWYVVTVALRGILYAGTRQAERERGEGLVLLCLSSASWHQDTLCPTTLNTTLGCFWPLDVCMCLLPPRALTHYMKAKMWLRRFSTKVKWNHTMNNEEYVMENPSTSIEKY